MTVEPVVVVSRRIGFTVFVDEAIAYRDRTHFISHRGFRMASCGFGRGSQRLAGRPMRRQERRPVIAITCMRCLVIQLLALNREHGLCEVSP